MDRTAYTVLRHASVTRVIVAVALTAFAEAPCWAQVDAPRPSISDSDAFRERYSDIDVLLDAFDRGQAVLYERLLGVSHAQGVRSDDEIYEELESGLRSGASHAERAMTPNYIQAASRAKATFDWAHGFRRRIYEILADARIADHVTAVEHAVDDYLRQTALALAAEPKSLTLIGNHHGHDRSRVVHQEYPQVSGLIWAFQWLQLALCEPLIAYDTPEARRAGVSATVSRFWEMLEHPPGSFPSEMPTAPAIAPSFAQRHPRAAAIFDNVHLLHQVIANILIDEHREREPAIRDAIDRFASPQHLVVSRDEWMLMSLRRGIWWQGGPAIGRMDEPERNRRVGHAGHGRMPLPGMGDVPADLPQQNERGTPVNDAHGQH